MSDKEYTVDSICRLEKEISRASLMLRSDFKTPIAARPLGSEHGIVMRDRQFQTTKPYGSLLQPWSNCSSDSEWCCCRGFARKRMEEEAGTYQPIVDMNGDDGDEDEDDDWGDDEDWLEEDEVAAGVTEEAEEEDARALGPNARAGGSGTGAGQAGGGSSGSGYMRRRS